MAVDHNPHRSTPNCLGRSEKQTFKEFHTLLVLDTNVFNKVLDSLRKILQSYRSDYEQKPNEKILK